MISASGGKNSLLHGSTVVPATGGNGGLQPGNTHPEQPTFFSNGNSAVPASLIGSQAADREERGATEVDADCVLESRLGEIFTRVDDVVGMYDAGVNMHLCKDDDD